MFVSNLSTDQQLFLFSCACRVLGKDRDTAVKGISGLCDDKTEGGAGAILASLRAEGAFLMGKNIEKQLFGGDGKDVNSFLLEPEPEIDEERAIEIIRGLFQDKDGSTDARATAELLFELVDLAAAAALLGGTLQGSEEASELREAIEKHLLSNALSGGGRSGTAVVFGLVVKSLLSDEAQSEPDEVLKQLRPMVTASADLIAASLAAEATVDSWSGTGETLSQDEPTGEHAREGDPANPASEA